MSEKHKPPTLAADCTYSLYGRWKNDEWECYTEHCPVLALIWAWCFLFLRIRVCLTHTTVRQIAHLGDARV